MESHINFTCKNLAIKNNIDVVGRGDIDPIHLSSRVARFKPVGI